LKSRRKYAAFFKLIKIYYIFFLPLIILSVYWGFVKKEFKLLALFFSSASATFSLALIANPFLGYRTLAFTDQPYMFMVIFGFQHCIVEVYKRYRAGGLLKLGRGALLIKCFFILMSLFLLFTLVYFKLSEDICAKYRYQEDVDSYGLNCFVDGESAKGTSVYYFMGDSTSDAWPQALLRVGSEWWRRPVYYSGLWWLKYDDDFFRKSGIITFNRRYNIKSNDTPGPGMTVGTGIYWPPGGFIRFNAEGLSAGKYSLEIFDSSLLEKDFENIGVYYADKNGKSIPVNGDYALELLPVRLPESLPPVTLPHYWLAFKAINYMKPDFLTVRKEFLFRNVFEIKNEAVNILLKNNTGYELNLKGEISLSEAGSSEKIFAYDLYRDSAEKLNNGISLDTGDGPKPLLWRSELFGACGWRIWHPDPEERTRRKLARKPLLLVLQGNFRDMKYFEYYGRADDFTPKYGK
jgi:hypothetical protein